jgi:Transcriptional regulator
MDVFQLEYMLAVARYKHFTHAANAVCISQSALSHQIGNLEEELGVQLFKRTTRAVYLTPAGKEFVEYASRIVSETARARHAMRQHATAESGELILGIIPTIGLLGLTADIAGFQNIYPQLQLTIKEEYSEQLLGKLLANEIDVALLTPPADCKEFKDVDFYPLITDKLVLVVHSGHPLAAQKSIDLSDMKEEKFIFMNANSGLHKESLEVCRNAGFEPNVILQSRQVETVLGFVAAGLGSTIIAYRAAKFLKKPSHALVHFNNAPKRITALAILKNNHFFSAVKLFQAFMLKQFKVVAD